MTATNAAIPDAKASTPASSAPVWEVEVVRGRTVCDALGESWDDLFRRASHASWHMSRAFASTWIEDGGLRGEPAVIVARRDGRLAGLLPLMVRRIAGVRLARPIGSNRGYLGVLVSDEAPEAADALAANAASAADCIVLNGVLSRDQPTQRFIESLANSGWFLKRRFRDVVLGCMLGSSYDEFLEENKSSKSRWRIRRKQRDLHQNHNVHAQRYRGSCVDRNVVERCARIHNESWMKRRGGAFLCEPFYQKLVLRAAAEDLMDVWIMTLDGDDAAFAVLGRAHGVYYGEWPAFKLRYATKQSIGQALKTYIIASACEEGLCRYDYGGGDGEHKRFWSNTADHMDRVVVGYGVRGRLAAMAICAVWSLAENERIKRAYRKVKRALRKKRQRQS